MQMAPNSPPSFFIIFMDHSAPNLELPPDFVSKHLKNKIPQNPIIQCPNGGPSWKLKIEKVGENYCFALGWNNVVKDINLGFGDFLVFRLVDQSTFNMFVYNPSGCQKNITTKINVEQDDDVDDDDDMDHNDVVSEDDHVDDDDVDGNDDDVDDDMDDGDPFFISTLSKSYSRMLRLPEDFASSTGINSRKNIQMKNLDGEEWQIGVRLNKSSRATKRYLLCSGWFNFRRSNNLSDGDKCVFKFIKSEGKLCLAKVTKKKLSGK